MHTFRTLVAASAAIASTQAFAGTETWFTPLTESAPVTAPNSTEELTAPWVSPAGIPQVFLFSLRSVEDVILGAGQTVGRAPNAGNVASMFDMIAYDDSGENIFVPHESPWGAGVTRHNIFTRKSDLLFAGDYEGQSGDWSNDWGAFDPCRYTPNGTLWLAEEWTAEGRVMEVLNPYADPADIQIRELESIANVAHEGINFSEQFPGVVYFIDEWRSGSIYKVVFSDPSDYTSPAQTYVLVVDAFAGNPADYFSDASNDGQPRTGAATWVAITDANGNPTTTVSPFKNGPTNDPRENSNTRGGRPAADEVNGTPYGRPEDMEVSCMPNGNEVIYFTATSETTIYSVEMLGGTSCFVRNFADASTPTNVGFASTTGSLNSPDNLAQDALGNIYIIEDAPNGSSTGGDIWFARDADNDGVAESLDHFLSIRVDGSEATGMIFNPQIPTEFVNAVQHPDSTDLGNVPDGMGDAVWLFDISAVNPLFTQYLEVAKIYPQYKIFLANAFNSIN